MKSRVSIQNVFFVCSILFFTTIFFCVSFVDSISLDRFLTNIYDSLTSGNDIGKFTLTWIPGNSESTGILDENDKSIMSLSPAKNSIYNAESNTTGGAKVTYQLMFNMGGNTPAPPGSIIIKIPKNVFFDRNNEPAVQIIDIPLAEYPNNQGTGFNYRFETDDATGKEYVVLENYQTIPESYSFEASMSWILKTPSTVKDQYVHGIKGEVFVDLDLDGTTDLYSESNELTLKYFSHAKISSLSDRASTHTEDRISTDTNVYLNWNSAWNSSLKPDNPNDYIYTINYAYSSVYYATQPYSLEVRAYPTDTYGGEVLGYCSNSSCSSTATIRTDHCVVDKAIPSEVSHTYSSCGFIIKYPKSNFPENVDHTISNRIVEDLIGVDGATDSKEATYTGTFKISDPEPPIEPSSTTIYLDNVIPGASESAYKSYLGSSNTAQGGINIIENKENGTRIPFGNIVKEPTSSFKIGSMLQHYKLTLGKDDTDSPDALQSYGKTNWKYNLVDDLVYMGNNEKGYTKLDENDYEFESLYIYSMTVTDFVDTTTSSYNSTTKVTTYRVGWQNVTYSNYNDYPILSIFAKVNNEYRLLGQIRKTSGSTYRFKSVDSEEEVTVASNSQLKLPSGTTAIKVTSETNKHSINLRLHVKISLINNDKLKSIVEGQDSVSVYNYIGTYAEDSDGNIYDYSSKGTLPTAMKESIEALDIAEYGMRVLRTYQSNIYNRFKKGKTNVNKWVNYQNDPIYRRVKANYTAYEYDYLEYQTGYYDYPDLFDIKAITEQKNGTFYDLLPIGVSPDLDSIDVQTFVINTSYGLDNTSYNIAKPGIEVNHTATIIDNYNNTGRTMLIVKVKLKDEDRNIQYHSRNINSVNHHYAYSGFKITFSAYYSWDSIIDYGNTLTNSIAYKSLDNELYEGYPDDATNVNYNFNDKNLFVDLDKDGNPPNTKSDTIYAQRTLGFSFNTASDSSFKISVKTANMTDYVDGKTEDVVATPGGYYTYKLRYESQKNVVTKNLIIYNDLEKYVSTNTENTWQGRIVNVDVSHAYEKGINPVIYYSIKPDIDLYQNGKATIDIPLPEDAILSNGEIWTTERPADSFKIKAIAVDLSKDQEGNDYVFQSEESVIILVTMQAPTENVEQLENDRAKALNAAWWAGITKQGDEPEHLNFSVYENTAVVVGESKAEITKSSYVESGTSSAPTIIHNGDKIIYDVKVSNTSTYESITNVKVVDNLPEATALIEDDLSYYIDGIGDVNNSIKVTDNNVVSYNKDNQKLTLTINQLNSQESMHLLIPVIVNSKKQSDDVIKNTAAIVEFNDIEYVKNSPPTYHEAKYGNIKITKILKNAYDTDDEQSFRIKITLLPNDNVTDDNPTVDSINNRELMMNATYSDVEFVDGVGYIELKNNESKTIKSLPEGIGFKIEEDLDENFSPKISKSEGTIIDNETIEIEILNERIVEPNIVEEQVVNPATGIPIFGHTIYVYDIKKMTFLVISIIGDLLGLYFLRKNMAKEKNS